MAKKPIEDEGSEPIKSPKQLGTYVHATRPLTWVALAAITAVVVAFLVWSVFGYITIDYKTKVFSHDGETLCWINVEDAWQIELGQVVVTSTTTGVVEEISTSPVSYSDLYEELGYQFVEQLNLQIHDAYYRVKLMMRESMPDHVIDGRIMLGVFKPISILFKGESQL